MAMESVKSPQAEPTLSHGAGATPSHSLLGAGAFFDYQPTVADLSLEAGLRVCHAAMLAATTRESRRAAFRLLAELHAQRSPAMLAHLGERGQGG